MGRNRSFATLGPISYSLYIVAFIAFLSGLCALLFRLNAYRRNTLGHALHRISLLAKAYQMNKVGFDASYLLSKLPPKLYRAINKDLNSQEESGEYNSPTNEVGIKKLRWMIQENAFFNATLYRICARQTLIALLIIGLVCGASVLLIIPMADGETEFLILRLFLVFLSLAIFYDQIECWNGWRAASKAMLELENELARFRELPEHRALLLFSNYQVTICNAPAIIQRVYDANHERLNVAWSQRIANLNEEWKGNK